MTDCDENREKNIPSQFCVVYSNGNRDEKPRSKTKYWKKTKMIMIFCFVSIYTNANSIKASKQNEKSKRSELTKYIPAMNMI